MQICRFGHELLVRKSRRSATQRKKVSKGTVRSQKGDYRRHRFGGNNEAAEERIQEIEFNQKSNYGCHNEEDEEDDTDNNDLSPTVNII